jgi:signal peptidase
VSTRTATVATPVHRGARHGRTALRQLGRSASALLSAVLVAAVVVLAVASAVVPRLVGGVPLTVLSGSMEPTLSPGDLVVVRPVDPAALQVGDVVTFQPHPGDPALVTHRVTAISAVDGEVSALMTRGDANLVPDDLVLPQQVQGRVLYSVPLVGHLTHHPWARTAAIAAVTALLVRALWTAATPTRTSREESPR